MLQSHKNGFSRVLAEISADCPVAEKRLLSPSRRVGHQWLYRLARAGTPCLNWRVETLRSIAVELAAPAMARAGVTVASRPAATMLAGEVLATQSPRMKYLDGVHGGADLAAALVRTFNAVREEGIDAGRLRSGLLEDDLKAEDLRRLLGGYLDLLARERLVDYGGVLGMALERLAADPAALGPDTTVVFPGDLERCGLERAILDALPADRLRELPVGEEGLPAILHFSAAVGEANEVRCALRSCLAAGIPFDEVELLHTDADTYIPMVLETFEALDRPATPPPVTFAEGIPCDRSRPGRALAAWMRWLREDFPQRGLVEMVREGLLEITGEEEETGGRRLAGLLRSLGIGFGRERYLRWIDRRIAFLARRLHPGEGLGGYGEDEGSGGTPGAAERDLAALRALRRVTERLLSISPAEDAGDLALVSSARRFLVECACGADRMDSFARERMDGELQTMAHWLERTRGSGGDMRQWIEDLPGVTRVLGSGPRPGHLHVDHVLSGGHSGRRRLFVVGLDDGRFPGAGFQDPLLLDGERRGLSPRMGTAGSRMEESVAVFRRLLARHDGEMTLSWSCRDIAADSERFPCSVVLEAFRSHTGEPGAVQRDLLANVGLPSSFAPVEAGDELDVTEWWLRRLTEGKMVADPAGLLARQAPHLARGAAAVAARRGPAFTPWDGCVPAAGADLDPTAAGGRVLSANSLETAGACPLRFFFRYALDLAVPEEMTVDPSRWLDPAARGLLLHDLFEDFLRSLSGRERGPSLGEDRDALLVLLEKKIALARDRYPPPSEAAFRIMSEELRGTAETFLKAEEVYRQREDNEPAYLEASIGLAPGGEGTDIDCEEEAAVDLPGGETIRVRGRIDRIDRRRRGGWVIWDYKTGGSYGFAAADPFSEGRKVQSWLYLQIVEGRLREVVSPDEKVHSFGYFFPSLRSAGERIAWEASRLEGGGRVVRELCRLITAGAFIPTTDAGRDCLYCDYRPLCGDVESQAGGSMKKIMSGEELLGPIRTLREAVE